MAKYRDLRPTRPDDSLKKLLGRADNKQTVPHGVKVAQPGEYVDFYAMDGVAHRWDGDTIAEYDTRIAEGAAAVAAAQESLAEAESELGEAKDRIAAVEQGTTPEVIGDTAAAQINERRLIIGRDAILTGTVDVVQLNVTGDMAAQIVSAMSVESKKLVVTEDAILNRATVVQSLVTPELVAQKVNSALVTGSVIQTSSTANQGVKIDSNGYKAYDSAGNLAVNLDGKDNRVVGSFATSYDDSSGVKITQKSTAAAIDLYTPNWGGNALDKDSHAGIWYSVPAIIRDRGLNIVATDQKQHAHTDPGIFLRPGTGSYGFSGRVSADSAGTKSGKYTDSGGIPAGSYTDYTFSFLTSMAIPTGGHVMVLPSITNQSRNETLFTVFDEGAGGFKLRVVNGVPGRATGTLWIKWVAFVV